ncbi:CcoQ/FixQ family Cbb3-type cytochrome c oxidase assembly chaperone [uncultured Eudoraea sp.]|uniref:CcoQ/FixQ family Cbb3-type cytochrome c oxidase assembly chaperone n=2 Tax=Eudoraea TaxID=446680 RepID=UPI0017A6B937|nr:CcoQ/FixQ family Cbb3-type cytochrome c oxidase assembly chaperone [uncultured Eudoraea sp.]MBT8182535.1 CcoQ/FixQ family Cbb3-type cytochrome c oxidase assembly chaperone [Eudoraea sp.]NNL00707.1 CcoQ/FixQ family Cbb3-type cytochrome c oxidase assembly chaperone [Eudoraea sp.]
MLKFIKNHMESMEGIATYPMISLLIFFVFFAILFWWVFTASKEHIKEVSEIPLEDNQPKQQEL